MFCSNCGNKLDYDSLFCMKCGVKLSENLKHNYCEYCGEKIEDESQFCIKCGEKIVILSNKINKQDQIIYKQVKNAKLSSKPRIFILILFILVSIITSGLFGLSYYFYKTSQDEIKEWTSKYKEQTEKNLKLDKDIKKLQSDYNKLQRSCNLIMTSNCGVFVHVNRFYNKANQAERLNHSKITYLMIDYIIYKSDDINANKEVFIKIYDSKWQLMQGASSPSGYTTSVEMSSNNIGWGRENPGSYQAGMYTVEFWFDNMCLCRKKVEIY